MSAKRLKHKPKSHYDIESFISQLLSSQKFDELADKIAKKAVDKIKNIEPPSTHLERLTDENEPNINIDTPHKHRESSKHYIYDKQNLENTRYSNEKEPYKKTDIKQNHRVSISKEYLKDVYDISVDNSRLTDENGGNKRTDTKHNHRVSISEEYDRDVYDKSNEKNTRLTYKKEPKKRTDTKYKSMSNGYDKTYLKDTGSNNQQELNKRTNTQHAFRESSIEYDNSIAENIGYTDENDPIIRRDTKLKYQASSKDNKKNINYAKLSIENTKFADENEPHKKIDTVSSHQISNREYKKDVYRDKMNVLRNRFVVINKSNKTIDTQHKSKHDTSNVNNIKLSNKNHGIERKIDTHAVMVETTSESESLNLKYKYLNRHAPNRNKNRNLVLQRDKHEELSIEYVNKDNNEVHNRDSKTESHEQSSHSKIDGENRWQHKSRENGGDLDRERIKQSNQHSDVEDESNEDIDNEENTSDNTLEKYSLEDQHSTLESKTVVEDRMEKKGVLEKKATEDESLPSLGVDDPEPSAETTRSSKEIVSHENEKDLGPNFRAEDGTYLKIEDNNVINNNGNKEGHQSVENTSKKTIIHREGNKVYALVDGPEYAEYHDQMAKLLKDKDKAPVDFVMV